MSFKSLGVHPALIDALASEGKTAPFPIQKATLPEAIAGRDVLGRGQTGSGKTLAFGLAMMTRLAGRQAKPHHPLGLILAPTRELAVQISEVVAPLARTVQLNSQVVAGGMPYMRQIQALKRGVPIIVATPGRLMDLLDKRHIDLSDVEITVLDEADQMADMGFLPSVKEILELTKANGQRLLFSATLDRDVDSLVKRFLKDPVTHSLENEKSTEANMEHHVLIMDQAHKDVIATQIAAREGRTIFFVRTKHGADKLAEKMLHAGVPVGVLHGGKSQSQRTRVLAAFKEGRTNALVATDVAARGIHVDGVSLVVHVDAPADHKDYLHRAGRTARAGATGTVVTLSTSKQKKGIHGLVSRAAIKLKEAYVRPFDEELVRVTGAQEPSGVPIEAEKEISNSRSRGDRGDRGDRGGRGGYKGSRPERSDRSERSERPDFPKRDSRPNENRRPPREVREEWVKKPAAVERTERTDYKKRPDFPKREAASKRTTSDRSTTERSYASKSYSSKDSRAARPERSERPDRAERSERPARFEKASRPERSERPTSRTSARPTGRPDRAERSERSERPARPDRFDKKKFDAPSKKKSAAAKPFRTNKFDPMIEKPTDGFRAKSAAKKSAKKAAPGKPAAKGGKKAVAKKVAGKKPRTKSNKAR